jgi:hypothetical protein
VKGRVARKSLVKSGQLHCRLSKMAVRCAP